MKVGTSGTSGPKLVEPKNISSDTTGLTASQLEVYRSVINSYGESAFSQPHKRVMLQEYCRICVSLDEVARQINEIEGMDAETKEARLLELKDLFMMRTRLNNTIRSMSKELFPKNGADGDGKQGKGESVITWEPRA